MAFKKHRGVQFHERGTLVGDINGQGVVLVLVLTSIVWEDRLVFPESHVSKHAQKQSKMHTYNGRTIIERDGEGARGLAGGVDHAGDTDGGRGLTSQGVIGEQDTVDHGAVAVGRSSSGCGRGCCGGGGKGRGRQATEGFVVGGVASLVVTVALGAKVDTQGNTDNDHGRDDSNQDLVLGLHGLLSSSFNSHFSMCVFVEGDDVCGR